MSAHIQKLFDAITVNDHSLGPQYAPVTVVEYGDFECRKCKQAAGAVKLLLARFEHRVRFVFRHFPLEEFHPYALLAAEVAECAGVQERFWQMHDLLFENQDRLELVRLHGYARAIGLDIARFTADLKGEVHLPRVREQRRCGERGGIRATPTFFVNGQIQDVSFGMNSLFTAVQSALRMEAESLE